MSAGDRIASSLARGHNKLRGIRLSSVSLKTLTGSQSPYTTTATYTNNFYLSKKEYSDLVGQKKYKRLIVEDLDGTRLTNLKSMTAVQVGSVIYKFHSKDSFIGTIKSYEFRVYPTGERV